MSQPLALGERPDGEVYSGGRETFPNLLSLTRALIRSLQRRERDISQPLGARVESIEKFTAEGERHFRLSRHECGSSWGSFVR
jgi:hypothetical protein